MWPPSHLPVRKKYLAKPTLTPGWAEFWRGCDWVQRAWILVTCPHSLLKLLWEPGEQIKPPERKEKLPTLPDGKAPTPHLMCQLPSAVHCFWSQPRAHLRKELRSASTTLTYPGLGTCVSQVPVTQRIWCKMRNQSVNSNFFR